MSKEERTRSSSSDCSGASSDSLDGRVDCARSTSGRAHRPTEARAKDSPDQRAGGGPQSMREEAKAARKETSKKPRPDKEKQKKKKRRKEKDKEKKRKRKARSVEPGGGGGGPVQLSKYLKDETSKYSIVSGKKIKLRVEKTDEDIEAERRRAQLLAYLNSSYD